MIPYYFLAHLSYFHHMISISYMYIILCRYNIRRLETQHELRTKLEGDVVMGFCKIC